MVAPSQTPRAETVEGTDLRLMAFQMRSTNFGTGGRFVESPSAEELESVRAEEIDRTRQYYWGMMARR
ncbi:hypothetical protein KJ652_07460 [Patescibacteria group bacterium]|nr:hypothetical protein [Patescibacteria group bacterium]MBU1124383.1 hypothetical protein [Patescibacteria group bacterium]MBU1911199.1 hypothetical protein [Patescibacteria group bacterium]